MLQQINFGVQSLRIYIRFKSNKFPADCVLKKQFPANSQIYSRQNKFIPANTGSDNNNNIAVIKIAHTNTN